MTVLNFKFLKGSWSGSSIKWLFLKIITMIGLTLILLLMMFDDVSHKVALQLIYFLCKILQEQDITFLDSRKCFLVIFICHKEVPTLDISVHKRFRIWNFKNIINHFLHLMYRCCILGSSTACVIVFDKQKNILNSANLGDSGFLIFRKGKVLYRSSEQQHYFNTPYQLASPPPDQEGTVIQDRWIQVLTVISFSEIWKILKNLT